MKKAALVFLLLSGILSVSSSRAGLVELSESEMSEVYGSTDIASNLLAAIEHRISSGEDVSGEEIMQQLQMISRTFGVSLENISIQGERNGNLQMVMVKDGKSLGSINLPSQVEQIHIGSIRVNGTGASMGSITVQNINVQGQIKVSIR